MTIKPVFIFLPGVSLKKWHKTTKQGCGPPLPPLDANKTPTKTNASSTADVNSVGRLISTCLAVMGVDDGNEPNAVLVAATMRSGTFSGVIA